jgi:hypothetical protein
MSTQKKYISQYINIAYLDLVAELCNILLIQMYRAPPSLDLDP